MDNHAMLFAVPVLTRSTHEDGKSNLFEEHIYAVEATGSAEAVEVAKRRANADAPEYEVEDGSRVRWSVWMIAEPKAIGGPLISGTAIYTRRTLRGSVNKWWELQHCWVASDPGTLKHLA